MHKILHSIAVFLLLSAVSLSAAAQRFSLSGIAEAAFLSRLGGDQSGTSSLYLPAVTLGGTYDAGRGWTLAAEAEFTYPCPADEPGGERRPEFMLSEFYIEKSFSSYLNIKAGFFALPVGHTGRRDTPLDFFTVAPPAGEAALLPVTWKQTGLSLGGEAGRWNYEAMLTGGLDAPPLNYGDATAASVHHPYEFNPSNGLSVAARGEYAFAPAGLLALSAHHCAYRDTLRDERARLTTAALNFHYEKAHRWMLRALLLYRAHHPAAARPENAVGAGAEAGFNLLSLSPKSDPQRRLYAFARYDYANTALGRAARSAFSSLSAGFNYFPLDCLVLKAHYTARLAHHNTARASELCMSIAYTGDLF